MHGATASAGEIAATAPDLTIAGNSVRLEGTDYRVTVDLPSEAGRGRASGTIVVHANPDRSVPPIVLRGTGGWISGYTVPVMAGTMDGELRADGTRLDLSGGSVYHDHNWGFWDGVSWQWGQVQHEGLSFVYGRVRPPADAADQAHVPGFLAVLGPDGPLAFSTDATIEETNATGAERPSHIVVRASGEGLDATLIAGDVSQTTTTPGREGRGPWQRPRLTYKCARLSSSKQRASATARSNSARPAVPRRFAAHLCPPRRWRDNDGMVVIYGKEHCPYTQAAKNHYTGRGIAFDYVNVKIDKAGMARMLEHSSGHRRACPSSSRKTVRS